MLINLLDEITNGHDGLIKRIDFSSFESVVVEIVAMKRTTREWVSVRFELQELIEFSVRQKAKNDNTVLSNGIAYQYVGDVHYIDFSPYSNCMENIDDFRLSDVYFAAHNVNLIITPYIESIKTE